MEKMKWIKKGISALLALNMVLSSVPLPAFAATTDNLCEHHTEHTAECGYREGSAGSACTHEHSEDCYAILECLHTCGEECADGCNHECTVDNGCVRLELDCHHVHGDCGYSEGTAEVPCGHVHNENCGYVEAVAGNPCANAETDPECDHSGDCGFVAAVEGQPCGHTACDDTCGYAPATEGTPCTHVCEVKVDSDDSCYKLLCSHSSGGHDDVCGYAAAVEAHECHYECAECANSDVIANQSADWCGNPLCSQEDAFHVTSCAQYVAPENPQCFCVEKCTEPNVWCDVCGFDVTGCTGEAKPAVGGRMAISSYSGDTVYVHLTLKAVDVSGNEVSTTFNSYIEQDIIDNREGYGADFYVGDTYCLSGFDIDGYTVKDEEITFTVYSSGNISINSGNASVEYGSDTTYIVIPVNCIGGDRVTIDCSTIDLNVNPYHAWGPGWYADGSVDLHELILTEPYIFILENSESMTKDNVEYIRILGGAILEAGTLADGVLVYAENGKIQSGTFISHVNVYADGEICGGTFNNVVNKGIISAGTFNGELTNYGTITNQGIIQLGEDFVLVQNGNVDCNAHIWRDGICRLCSVTCQHSWTNGTCTVCDLVCGHSGGTTKPTDNGNGTHSVTCTVCGGITEVHTFDENGTCVCGVNLFTVSGSTLTIDGTLGGKTEATEEDITVLVNKIKDCVDNGITTITVTGEEPALIEMDSWTNTAIGEAIYRLSGSDDYDENNPYNGKIDLILQDVTEIVDQEFYSAWALNSITLPQVIKMGDEAFSRTWFLKTITFESVLTEVNETGGVMFALVGKEVGGCDLILNCGQMDESSVPAPDLTNNIWKFKFENEFKSITLTHSTTAEGDKAATCTSKAYCSVCKSEYGEVGGHTPAEDATYTDNGDGTHSYTCTDCKETVAEDHSGGTATCTTLAVCTVCGVSYGDVDTTNHDETVAFDSNGFCPKGCYEPATDSDSDGVYEIGNAGQLYWFAAQVNSGEKSINAVLMNDIDLTNHTWTPIGVTAMGEGVTDGYTGTFDGQGHVISNITFATPTSAMAAGIFGSVQSGGTVKNLGVENLTFDNNDYDHRAAGIAGQLLAGSTISDCYVINSTVKASSRVVGGIVGMNKGTVKNCYTCNMTLAAYNNRFGGISGDYSGGKLENCYTDYSALASSQAGTATNCEAGVSAERFASGEVAYLLGDPWGQTIGTDTSPNFTGGTVYQVTNCKNETVYSNTNETIGHSYENGICTVCGGYEPATDSDSDGYYEITNAGQLYWFAQQVNSGSTAINGELTADIKVNENVLTADGALNGDGSAFRVWTPIGTEDNAYTGEFRGSEHTVSGLYFNSRSADYVGLFGYVGSGGTVENVGVIDSYFYAGSYVGGVAGCNRGTLQSVYNTGNVNGSKYAGGVVGENNYIVQYAYNTGTVFAMDYAGGVTGYNNYILQYAYNTGFAGGAAYYGGIAGDNRHTLKDCYYLADSETDSFDGTTAKTAGQFEIGEVAYLLNGDQSTIVFKQTLGEDGDAAPNFTGGTVYQVTNCKSEVAYSNTNEDIGHIGGTATCTELAVCTVCGESYGEVSSHTPDAAGYTDNGDGTHSYTCTVCGTVTEDHTGGTATSCTTQANCEYCGASYGEVDTTNHDETVAFDSNGFCPNGCYEPAMLNGEVYEISNAGQLYWFAQQVNSGETTINAILMNDIAINSQVLDADGNLISDTSGLRQWTPIGHYNSDTDNLGFAGTFDGNGKTISGLYHYGDTARYAGLFGYSAGTIRDLTIADTYIHTTHSDGRAGSVTGLNEGTVSNCSNYGIVVGVNQVGGIIGRIIAGLVENCTNYGTVNSTTHAGGICGCASGGTINNCYNTGSVKADSSVGGIAGSMQNTSNISNCISVGTVEGSSQAGGVVGYVLNNSTTNATITNCYHDNTVCGYAPVGVNGGSNASATLTKVEGKTTEAFASGEVTWLLNGKSAEGIWKQTLDTDTYPSFTGGTVYHGNCGGGVPYSNDAEEVMNHNCNAENGYRCSNTLLSGGVCNVYESASQNAEGYYEIYNASQLYWFAEQVNGGAKSINAVLMNDIDLTNHTWTPIGVTAMGESVTDGYTGTFDGQGHVISNITFAAPTSAMAAGIFGTVQSGGTVKNLGVENLTFDNNDHDHRAAGIAGQLLADSTISDCYVINSTVKASSRVVGGIVGMNRGTVKNCYTCNMTLAGYNNRFGGISGDYSGGKLENCYTDYSALASSEAGTTTNCEAGVSAERFASGEIAYALGNGWGQTIGTDGCPVYGGATVYQVANTGCPAQGEYVYSNVNEAVAAAHKYTNGFCACGGYEEAVQNADGYYVIDNGGKLFWFAELVNNGNNTINAVLTADIDLENRNWTPIGTQNESVSPNVKVPYMGVFNGQCHVIKNLSIHVTDGREAGLFGRAQDATLLNFGVVDATVVSDPVNGTGYRAGIVAGELHRCTVANVYSAGNLTVTTTHAQAGGIAGECADSTLTNCFTTYGCLTASNAALPAAVTNCYYLAESENTGSCGDYKTADQFASGEVAWLLNGSTDQGDLVWYQNIGMDAYPKFEGLVVNYNTDSDTYHNGNTVSVSISWTEMSFTYTAGEWDPETHTYTGSWTADDGAAQITVKNVGAANVPVRFTFAGTMGEVTGQFDVEKAALAPGRAVTTTLTVSGDPQKSGFVDEQIGTVTVSLGSSGWAVGDKVTFYSKGGTDYACVVSEETTVDNLVLRSETYFVDNVSRIGVSDKVSTFVENYVTAKGARLPSAKSSVITDSFIHSTLMAALTPSTSANNAVNFTIANEITFTNGNRFYYRYDGNNERFALLQSNLANKDVYYFLMWDFPAVN